MPYIEELRTEELRTIASGNTPADIWRALQTIHRGQRYDTQFKVHLIWGALSSLQYVGDRLELVDPVSHKVLKKRWYEHTYDPKQLTLPFPAYQPATVLSVNRRHVDLFHLTIEYTDYNGQGTSLVLEAPRERTLHPLRSYIKAIRVDRVVHTGHEESPEFVTVDAGNLRDSWWRDRYGGQGEAVSPLTEAPRRNRVTQSEARARIQGAFNHGFRVAGASVFDRETDVEVGSNLRVVDARSVNGYDGDMIVITDLRGRVRAQNTPDASHHIFGSYSRASLAQITRYAARATAQLTRFNEAAMAATSSSGGFSYAFHADAPDLPNNP